MSVWLFVLVGAIAVGFALALVLSRNAVHGALCLVVNFGALAVFFFVLRAEFIGIVQVAVYAGAIMVLFLFVMMLLNVHGSEEVLAERPRPQLITAVLLGVLFIAEVVLIGPRLAGLNTQGAAPVVQDFGSPTQIGVTLFSGYLLPFEITSLVLLAAMVGAVVLAKRRLA